MPASGPPESPPLQLHPFQAVRYAFGRGGVSGMLSPPYDNIDPAQIRNLRSRPHHISQLLDTKDPRASASALNGWLHSGILVRDTQPALYVYQQRLGSELLQQGLIGELELHRSPGGPVLPHEDVRPDVVRERAACMAQMRAQPEPLLLTCPVGRATAQVIDRVVQRTPVSVARVDGITHTLWACTDKGEQAVVALDLARRRALIADGHHRHAACLQLREQRCLAMLVDSSTRPMRLAAVHRVIPGLEPGKAAAAAAEVACVRPLPRGPRLPAPGQLVLAGSQRAWMITVPDPQALSEALAAQPAQWRKIPAAVTDHLLMSRAWSVPDLPDAVHHVHDAGRALAAVSDPGSGVAVLLPPMSETEVWELASAAVLLPRKSTSFGPKPPAGLVLRTLDPGSHLDSGVEVGLAHRDSPAPYP